MKNDGTGVESIAKLIRKIPGFNGKGFRSPLSGAERSRADPSGAEPMTRAQRRMKEIILDLAEATREQYPTVDSQLVDFGVVGPGPRRVPRVCVS